MKKFIKLLSGILLVAMLLTSIPVSAAPNPSGSYYKGFNITYNNGSGYLYYTDKNVGFLWRYTDRYYNTNSYYRCVTYYHDSWIANNGQTLTVTSTKTKTREVSVTVRTEIGVGGDIVSANIGSSMTTKASTTYSSSLSLSYDLSKASKNTYRIAAMGYIDKFNVKRYVTSSNKYSSNKYVYAYDAGYGNTITLVYRN